MATTDLDLDTAMTALETVDELIARQRARVLAAVRHVRPGLREADLRDPDAFPDVRRDPAVALEERRLAGLRAARIALRARLLDHAVARN